MVGGCEKGHLGVNFLRWSKGAEGMGCGRRWAIWVLQEQGLPIGVQECLEGFHQRCADHLSRYFIPKWANPNAESILPMAGTTSLLVELKGATA